MKQETIVTRQTVFIASALGIPVCGIGACTALHPSFSAPVVVTVVGALLVMPAALLCAWRFCWFVIGQWAHEWDKLQGRRRYHPGFDEEIS